MYRLLTAAVFVLWLSAMAALFVRDVLPSWTAQDFNPVRPAAITQLKLQKQQYGIFLGDGARIGTAWGRIEANQNATAADLHGTVLIEKSSIMNAILIETVSSFDAEGALDSFNLDVFGVRLPGVRTGSAMKIHVHGERRGIYFPCEMQFGTFFKEASLDVSASRLIGDSLRPFSYLPSLSVGQAWRMQILDPVAVALSGKTQFRSIIARVTGTETITVETGEKIECFVVETSPNKTKAWVDRSGCVRRQEVELPGFGILRISEEEYQDELLKRASGHIQTRGDDGK